MTLDSRRERKVITVVFADLVSFTERAERLDPEDIEAFLLPHHERLRTEFERFGGTVEKFIGDAVVAVFGAPIAHEDDPERAVRAALTIRDAIREGAKLEVRIAVNTGEAIVRLDAKPESGESFATGDVLNTASRLQAAAPINGILVGETTYNATRDAIRYEPVEAVLAKGKVEMVKVWEALEVRSRLGIDVRQASRIPLVGRIRERDLLVDSLARVEAERAPQLVTVVGVPGIGKSRLVYELFQELEAQPELRYWRQGRSLPYGQGVSFWALGEMVKAQAGILEGDEPELALQKLETAVRDVVADEEAGWVTGWLRPLVGLEHDGYLGAERRDESFAAWRRFFEGLAERRTLVLVFEDLHWADDGLLDFIDHLVDWASGVAILVLCTARPELLDRRPGWGGGKVNALTLGLSPLAEVDCARLIGLLLDSSVVPAETQRALLDRAGGNPLYAEQFARLYAERGSVDEIPLPENVQGLIAARIDTLSAAEKALLQEAAVMGKVFWSGALVLDPARPGTLHALERKEFIRRERRSSVAGQDEFAFRHVLVRDVAYGQIPRSERVGKHLRAAAWIDALGRPQDHAELLAYHYLAAMDLSATKPADDLVARARQALQEAGDRAFALNAFNSAISHYLLSLDLTAEADPQRPRLLFDIGRAHYRADGTGAAMLQQATAGLIERGDLATAAEAETLVGQIAFERGDAALRWKHFQRALELVSGLPPSREKAFVFALHARALYLAGSHSDALTWARRARAMARSLGLGEVRAHALNTIGLARRELNDGDGYEEMRESIALTIALNSVESFKGYNNLSVMLDDDGHIREAEEACLESGRIAQRFGLAADFRWFRFSLPYFAYLDGDWDEASRAIELLLTETEAGSPHLMEPNIRRIRARIRVARGDLSGALGDTSKALAIARALDDPQDLISCLALDCYVRGEQGAIEALQAELVELLEVRGRLVQPYSSSPSIEIMIAVTRLGRAKDYVGPFLNGRMTPWMKAAESIVDGDWVAAADAYARIGALPDEALARLVAAGRLVGMGRRSDAERQRRLAVAFFVKSGATRYMRDAAALVSASA